MPPHIIKPALLWGLALWLFGYLLGIVLFPLVPSSLIGWIITPFGTAVTILVLLKKIPFTTFRSYFYLSLIWTAIAVIFDYLFLVQLLKPADGYYQLDVYLYYALAFFLPLLVGYLKTNHSRK
jgi:hypothetical protein